MIQVSTDYFESINGQMRNQMDFNVGIGLENTELKRNAIYSDNGHLEYSDISGLKNLYASGKVYVTAESNMYILDGNHEIVPTNIRQFQGYVSDVVSGADSTFASPPQITIYDPNSTTLYDLTGFTILFDKENNDYPTEFTITYYANNTLVGTKEIRNNTLVKYIDDEEKIGINKIVITFLKTHNYNRRIRVLGITLGIYEEFTGSGTNPIISLSHDIEISPLSKEIPMNNFTFTIYDPDQNYDAENPQGIWKYAKKGQIITLKYIYTIDNETKETEEVAGGRFYMDSKPSTNDDEATFTSVSRIEMMEDTYNEGTYYPSGRSYKALFEDVFTFAGLSSSEYEIDASLADINTTIPLPKESCKQCIQLLCQATGTIAFEDVSGKIWIKKNNTELDDYMLELKTNLSFPKYSEEPAEIKNLVITKYTPTVDEELSQLAKTSFSLEGTADIIVDYDLSTDHTYTIEGATVNSGAFYANCCKLNLTALSNSEITLIVNGKKIDLTANNKVWNISSKGYDCELDFEMLSDDEQMAKLKTMYLKYLEESNRYSIEYRGNPELRPNDIIQLQTKFVDRVNAMILSTSYSYDGGSSGNIVLKNYR